MSELILPPGMVLPDHIQSQDAPSDDDMAADRGKYLPRPTGWRVLCVTPEIKDKFDGTGILKAQEYMKAEEHATTVLFVLAVGPEAYKDPAKFPSGAWCKPGDFVLVRTYAGTRFKVFGKEFRILNDDQIDGVVDDPRGIARIGA